MIGGITAGYNNFAASGATFTVIGAGTVTIGGEPNPAVLATVKRDLDGRQVMTVTDKTSFTVDIPLVSLQQLTANATSATNLVKALTATVPDDVKAQGPASIDYFQRLIAGGNTPEEAVEKLKDPYIQSQIVSVENLTKAKEYYGADQAIPERVTRLALLGIPLDFKDGEPKITGCIGNGTSGPVLCGVVIPGQNNPVEIARAARDKFESALTFLNGTSGPVSDDVRRELRDSLRAYWASNDAGMAGVNELIEKIPNQGLRTQVYQELRGQGRELITDLAARGDHANAIVIQAEIGRAESVFVVGKLKDEALSVAGLAGTIAKGPARTPDGQSIYTTEDGTPIYYNAVSGRYFAYSPSNPDGVIDQALSTAALIGPGGVRVVTGSAFGNPVITSGRFIGSMEGLTLAERSVANELVAGGNVIEAIPRGIGRTADFFINGVPTELKTVSNIVNQTSDGISSSVSSTIMGARSQSPYILIDTRGQPGMTLEIAERSAERAIGRDRDTGAKIKNITILTTEGIYRKPGGRP